MRVALVLGILSTLAAFALGAWHLARTGDATVVEMTTRAVVFSCLVAFLLRLRMGVPLGMRTA